MHEQRRTRELEREDQKAPVSILKYCKLFKVNPMTSTTEPKALTTDPKAV